MRRETFLSFPFFRHTFKRHTSHDFINYPLPLLLTYIYCIQIPQENFHS